MRSDSSRNCAISLASTVLEIVGSFLVDLQVGSGCRPGVHSVQLAVEIAVGNHDRTRPAEGECPMKREAPIRDLGSGSSATMSTSVMASWVHSAATSKESCGRVASSRACLQALACAATRHMISGRSACVRPAS